MYCLSLFVILGIIKDNEIDKIRITIISSKSVKPLLLFNNATFLDLF